MRVSINEAKLESELRQLDQSMKKLEEMTSADSGKILWQYSSQFAAQLVMKTQPRGSSEKAKQTGQAAVARDIDKVYAKAGRIYAAIKEQSESDVLANFFYASWMAGDRRSTLAAMERAGGRVAKIPLIAFDGGTEHHRARTSRGRVRANFNNAVLVEHSSAGKVKRYIYENQRYVGSTKAGWIKNFNPPSGVKGVPAWVLNNVGGKGRVVDKTKTGTVKSIIFENHMPWVSSNFNASGAMQALSWVRKRIEKDIDKAIKNNAKKL